jgi:hypothetical protein
MSYLKLIIFIPVVRSTLEIVFYMACKIIILIMFLRFRPQKKMIDVIIY